MKYVISALIGMAMAYSAGAGGLTLQAGVWDVTYHRTGKLAFINYEKKGTRQACLSGDLLTMVKAKVAEFGCSVLSEHIGPTGYTARGHCEIAKLGGAEVDVNIEAVLHNDRKVDIRVWTDRKASVQYRETAMARYTGAACSLNNASPAS
jgi:hypothetical protein